MSRVLNFVVILALGAVPAFAQGQGKHLGATKAKGIGGFGLGGPQLERLADFLNLTEQQLKDAQAIFETARTDREKLETQTGDIKQQIEALIKTSTAEFDTKIQTLVTAYTAAETQELAIKARAMNRFWNLLTPEQKQKAEELDKFLKAPGGNSGEDKSNNGNNGNAKGKK
jgi:Spy/CpxP family protein refolding chaperone